MLQGETAAEFADQGRVDRRPVRLFVLLKGVNECRGKDFFGFDFVTGHVEREREGAMAMAFIHVALFLFTGLFDSLGEDGFSGYFAFKFEQGHPFYAVKPPIEGWFASMLSRRSIAVCYRCGEFAPMRLVDGRL